MDRISVKGVLIGNIAHVLFFVAMMVLFVLVELVEVLATQGVKGLEHLELTGVSLYIGTALPAVAAVISGYISAIYVRERNLLHGALSTVAVVIFFFCADLFDLLPDSRIAGGRTTGYWVSQFLQLAALRHAGRPSPTVC